MGVTVQSELTRHKRICAIGSGRIGSAGMMAPAGWPQQAPLAAPTFDPAQQELAEPQHRLDDAEHRLRRMLAQGKKFLAVRRLQSMRHRLDQCWIFQRGRRRGETLSQGRMIASLK